MLKKERMTLLIAVVVLGSLLSPTFVHPAHAATGEICLADPTSGTGSPSPCTTSSPILEGPVGQQLRIGVFVSGSDGLDGFDVTLLTNHTVLTPAGVDSSGSVLLGIPVILAECLSGILITGSSCSASDTVDTLHLSATSALGQPLTVAPTTGLLFTAIYNITGTSPTSPVSVGYQTGCFQTSVSSNVCVTIANGTPSPNSETIQGASFDNADAATMAAVVMSASTTTFGPEFPGTVNVANVTATAMNGYPRLSSDSVTFSTKASPGLTITLSGTNPCSTGGTSCSLLIALSATAAGNYFATVFGTYATSDLAGNPDTLVAAVSFSVIIHDFGLSTTPTTLSFSSTTTGIATITLSSLNGFSGSVTLASGTIVPSGLAIVFSPNPVLLSPGSRINSTATFSANPGVATTYHAQIKATSGTRTRTSPTLTVTVAFASATDFSLVTTPNSIITSPGTPATLTVGLLPLMGFNNSVTLSTLEPTGLVCSLSQSTITSSETATLTCNGSSGFYSVFVTGTSGSLSHSTTVFFSVSLTTVEGLVCIASDGSTTCPVAPPLISTTGTIPQQLSVAIVVSDSPSLNGFDITLHTNGTVLKPSNVIQGTILNDNGLTVLAKCIGGFGTGCSSLDNKDTLHYAVVSTLSYNPVTGLLFTAIYNITGAAVDSPIEFLAGCHASSVSDICVTISSGTPAPDPEAIQEARFTNQPYFDLQPALGIGSLAVAKGTSDESLFLNVTSVNGFSGTISISSDVLPSGPVVALSPTTVAVNSTQQTSFSQVTLTVPPSASPGDYVLNFTATSGTLPSNTLTIPLEVPAPDFTVTVNPLFLRFNVSTSSSSVILLSSLGNFAGTVDLTVTPSPGLNASLIETNLALAEAGSNSTAVRVNATKGGQYSLNVTGTSDHITHDAIIQITVLDFSVFFFPANFTVQKGSDTAGTNLVFASEFPYNFTATIAQILIEQVFSNGTIAPSAGIGVTCNPTEVTVTTTTPIEPRESSECLISGAEIGNYAVTVDTVSGSISHAATFNVEVTAAQPPQPDFEIITTCCNISIPQGSNYNSTITLIAINGFTGNVTLSASVSPSGLAAAFAPSTIFLSSSSSSVFTISTGLVSPGRYEVTITATSGTVFHTASGLIFTVTATPTGTLTVSITTGSVYFPGDTVVVYALTGFNGVPVGPANVQLQLLLFRPNGSNVTLKVTPIGVGLYMATYSVPTTGPLGTYLVSAQAHESGPFDSSTITSFEVKPTWLSSNGKNIAGIATIVGLAGLIGITWKKGYLRRRPEDQPAEFS